MTGRRSTKFGNVVRLSRLRSETCVGVEASICLVQIDASWTVAVARIRGTRGADEATKKPHAVETVVRHNIDNPVRSKRWESLGDRRECERAKHKPMLTRAYPKKWSLSREYVQVYLQLMSG